MDAVEQAVCGLSQLRTAREPHRFFLGGRILPLVRRLFGQMREENSGRKLEIQDNSVATNCARSYKTAVVLMLPESLISGALRLDEAGRVVFSVGFHVGVFISIVRGI